MSKIMLLVLLLLVLSNTHSLSMNYRRLVMSNTNNFSKLKKGITVFTTSLLLSSNVVLARPEGVNRPDLLPTGEKSSIIDVANYLSKGQEKKVKASIAELEKNTGYKLRVLLQSYPNTPGLAIKEYWGVDDNTVVLVVDQGEGFNRKGIPSNAVNLNIGNNVDLVLGNQFWARLSNKLGNQPYIKKVGIDLAILNMVEAITFCLQDKECTDIPFQI